MKTGSVFKFLFTLLFCGFILIMANNSAKAQTCIDSDGLDLFQKGSVQVSGNIVNDYCTTVDSIYEFYCDGDVRKSLYSSCGTEEDNESCFNGECCGWTYGACSVNSDCCVNLTCQNGACLPPSNNVILNVAYGLSCYTYCQALGYTHCINVGTDSEASNGEVYHYNFQQNSCELYSDYRASCNTVIYDNLNSCGGREADWTYCNCGGSIPVPTPTPTSPPTPPPATACVLPDFGDVNGNPLRQNDTSWKNLAYGGRNYVKSDGNTVFLPFIWYGNKKDNIGNWGCKLTSAVMIVNYFAKEQKVIDPSTGSIFQTDPAKLNIWLQQNGGYFSGNPLPDRLDPSYFNSAGVDLSSIVKFSKGNGIQISWDGTIEQRKDSKGVPTESIEDFIGRTKEKVNSYMCSLNPVILKVKSSVGDHYIDATGKTLLSGVETWKIHDPIWNGVLPGTSTLKEKYNNLYSKVDLMSGSHPKRHLTINKYSPIEMLVIDPLGRKVGYDVTSDTFFEEIPSASYGTDSLSADDEEYGSFEFGMLDIVEPENGIYLLTVTGIGVGKYGLGIEGTDEDYNITSSIISGITVIGQTDIYKIEYFSIPGQYLRISRNVTVDVKPDSVENKINLKSNGVIPVALMSTSTFDALQVDDISIKFGVNSTTEEHSQRHKDDVNGDGKLDLVFHFSTKDLELNKNVKEICLTGKTTEGLNIEGCDFVKTF